MKLSIRNDLILPNPTDVYPLLSVKGKDIFPFIPSVKMLASQKHV